MNCSKAERKAILELFEDMKTMLDRVEELYKQFLAMKVIRMEAVMMMDLVLRAHARRIGFIPAVAGPEFGVKYIIEVDANFKNIIQRIETAIASASSRINEIVDIRR